MLCAEFVLDSDLHCVAAVGRLLLSLTITHSRQTVDHNQPHHTIHYTAVTPLQHNTLQKHQLKPLIKHSRGSLKTLAPLTQFFEGLKYLHLYMNIVLEIILSISSKRIRRIALKISLKLGRVSVAD